MLSYLKDERFFQEKEKKNVSYCLDESVISQTVITDVLGFDCKKSCNPLTLNDYSKLIVSTF